MYRIYPLCGKKDFSIRFNKNLNIKRLRDYFNDYEIIDESDDTINMRKGEKNILGFSYGEVIFTNFDLEDINKFASSIDKE
ncbi:hypothetical protein MJ1_0455 [Nanobdella aerobiophila]|uniref:Uncharacterized protein n=1 Tax=Nanobdella aerobiophila TaxID=2586965 RepID=A0A915SCR9_9ARCH|nr:hypothetical protein [Nanobdella aerobiophila]BBL45613.1 hypothetical protein MJ1_0455 [Nanobdella aerobiophila]